MSNWPQDKGKAKVVLRSGSRLTPGSVGVRGGWDRATPGEVRCWIRECSVALSQDKGKVHLGSGLIGVSSWVPS
jgi:hypothetical protein